METTMGRVLVAARIENLADLYLQQRGFLPQDQIRQVEVTDALVDTEATGLSLPKRLIEELGLPLLHMRSTRTNAGPVEVNIHDAVRLTIQERECVTDVMEVSDDCPVLIGHITLGQLDFVVDPKKRRIIGNPEHGGEHVIELYGSVLVNSGSR